jgi:hypothetical protein
MTRAERKKELPGGHAVSGEKPIGNPGSNPKAKPGGREQNECNIHLLPARTTPRCNSTRAALSKVRPTLRDPSNTVASSKEMRNAIS